MNILNSRTFEKNQMQKLKKFVSWCLKKYRLHFQCILERIFIYFLHYAHKDEEMLREYWFE